MVTMIDLLPPPCRVSVRRELGDGAPLNQMPETGTDVISRRDRRARRLQPSQPPKRARRRCLSNARP
jgi:hypothetical protein